MPISIERKKELTTTLEQMEHAADVFYAHAQRANFHQFLEFTGFLREYTKMCRRLMERGVDFASDIGELQPYEADYIGEKFGCIFSPLLYRSPGAYRAFLAGAELEPEKLP